MHREQGNLVRRLRHGRCGPFISSRPAAVTATCVRIHLYETSQAQKHREGSESDYCADITRHMPQIQHAQNLFVYLLVRNVSYLSEAVPTGSHNSGASIHASPLHSYSAPFLMKSAFVHHLHRRYRRRVYLFKVHIISHHYPALPWPKRAMDSHDQGCNQSDALTTRQFPGRFVECGS